MILKRWKIALVIGGVAILAGITYQSRKPEAKDLNILLISLDATRPDHFSFNGYPGHLTPNIDGLANSGVVFQNAYSYSGSTAPSMAALFTGRFPYWPLEVPGGGRRWSPKQTYGLSRFFEDREVHPGFPHSIQTLPQILKRHGYMTVGISTNPYLTQDFDFDRGFDFFEEFSPDFKTPYAQAEEVTRKLKAYISELRGKKFFAWIHFMDNHEPLLGFEEFLDDARQRGLCAEHFHQAPSQWTELARNHMENFGPKVLPNWRPSEENLLKALREYRLAYAGQLARVDEEIASLVELLKEVGIWEDTLVVIVSDHGDEFMEHGSFLHTGQLYEEIVRAVWILHNPKLFPEPVKVHQRVNLVDFTPTLVDLLRLDTNDLDFDGTSRDSLWGESDGEDGFVLGVLDQRAYAIDGDYKLIWNNDYGKPDHGAAQNPAPAPIELYNLKNDPKEQNNLAEEQPEVVDRLTVKLKHGFSEKGICFWADRSRSKEISDETRERLKALGYVE